MVVSILVTEYVDGGTLSTWARVEKRSWRQVVELLIGVADALATAHDAGILHRDIKPDNILRCKERLREARRTSVSQRCIEDGGHETRTVSGVSDSIMGIIAVERSGTCRPSRHEGQSLDSRSDIFSFGIVLYEVLSGRRPFDGAQRTCTWSKLC